MRFTFGSINLESIGRENWIHWKNICLKFKKINAMLNVADDIAGRELRFSRLLDAPIQLVWDVWSDPNHIKHWWGPDGFRNTITEMDLRPGGRWNLVMHGPDGRDYDVKCIFHEVVKCERIVYEQLTPFKYLAKIEFER